MRRATGTTTCSGAGEGARVHRAHRALPRSAYDEEQLATDAQAPGRLASATPRAHTTAPPARTKAQERGRRAGLVERFPKREKGPQGQPAHPITEPAEPGPQGGRGGGPRRQGPRHPDDHPLSRAWASAGLLHRHGRGPDARHGARRRTSRRSAASATWASPERRNCSTSPAPSPA